jgi:hypothetical protein
MKNEFNWSEFNSMKELSWIDLVKKVPDRRELNWIESKKFFYDTWIEFTIGCQSVRIELT